jgi:FKBP-type peptidyl-prolyl cis-trans isomerase
MSDLMKRGWCAAAIGGVLAAMAQTADAALAGTGTPAEQAFLTRNAQAAGIVALPGLQYRILKSGPADGPHPRRSDDITVRYVGRFLDGKVFNTSPDNGAGTTVFPLQKLIPGWVAALPLMRPGDVWMLYLPSYLAYGAGGKSYIPPDSTLVFQVELVAVTPHQDPVPTAAK